ncbi:MAG: ImmA/IrrE family metallo-endopeptidase [Candidatus Cloacimonetes bacterium]|jgi:Zn-dependent peptidase ImmA (M78 family)/DNA-binding XRE family transcriptional regulator|nr:ImmA/IrrE family metallo-endopeptidase [Candidatus Cloacimonadota bacterium]MDY0172342.1 ImmA/IrrE family metallo-endopeptidase [Candidatus Cloacimonadaceae bacterium]
MYVGGKIREYRERINLSGKGLAQRLGVSPAMVSYYEKGSRQVPLKTLVKISEITKVPIEYFITDKDYVVYSAYRGKGNISKEEREEVASFQEIVDHLINVANLAGFDLTYKGPHDFHGKAISDQGIGNIKTNLELPAVVDYKSLVEALWLQWKIVVFELPFVNRNLSAMTVRRDGVFCIFVNKGQSTERNLFSLAHELGHVLMHLDTDEFIVSRLGSRDPKEKEANDFASRFTVPVALLRDKLGDGMSAETLSAENIRGLAEYFNVSYECITYNLVKAKILQYNSHGVARIKQTVREYNDEITIDAFPTIYRLLVYVAWNNGDLSISKASKYLRSDIQTVNDEFRQICLLLGKE